MRVFIIFLKLLALVPVFVGLLHVIHGLGTDVQLGARVTAAVLADPVLDSQNRFYGTIFMGYGVLLYLCATDLRRHVVLFRILVGFVYLGGVARLLSMALHGAPSAPVVGLTIIELVGVPLLMLWHARVLTAGENRG